MEPDQDQQNNGDQETPEDAIAQMIISRLERLPAIHSTEFVEDPRRPIFFAPLPDRRFGSYAVEYPGRT